MENLEPTGDKITRSFAIVLTPQEIMLHAHSMASRDQAVSALEEKAKADAKRWKDEIGGERSQMRKHSLAITKGSEDRDVVCEWFADYTAKQFVLVREDTGAVVDARTMTAEELQVGLGLEEGGGALPEAEAVEVDTDDESESLHS